MIRTEDTIRIGRLGRPHGVRGEVNFAFTTDVWDQAGAAYLLLLADGLLVPFFLEEYRFRSDTTALVKFLDLDRLEDVQEYAGCDVYFPRSLVSQGAGGGEPLSWQYFLGFRVEDDRHGLLGRIAAVDEATENVLFEVAAPGGTLLVPAAEAFLREVDHQGRTLHMCLPDGLLDL